MAEEPKAPPPEHQKIAVEATGRIYDVLFEVGCGHFKQFMLAGTRMPKELDVRYAFDDPKIYEDLVKSRGSGDLVKKFARVMADTARFVAEGLGKEGWVQFGLHISRKGKDVGCRLSVIAGEPGVASPLPPGVDPDPAKRGKPLV